jgi:elongation factor Ts
MSYTAADVKNLRELTGVGMMDCKKALESADGDVDKAVEWLREKGMAAAQKKSGRVAAEGMAYASVVNGVGVLVEVNAESDFVAKNDLFVEFVMGVAVVVADQNPADVDALLACTYPGTGKSVQEVLNDKVLVIGENIKIRRFTRFAAGLSVSYVHMGGRIGVLLNMEVSAGLEQKEAVVELGKDLAMQIAAMNPAYLDKAAVPSSVIDKEKEILLAQINEDPKNAGKPDAIKEKMIVGRINKYYEDNCLLQQAYVKGDKESVERHITDVAKAAGGSIKVTAFARYERGEGIEKRQDDLACEVAKLIQ